MEGGGAESALMLKEPILSWQRADKGTGGKKMWKKRVIQS